MCPLDSALILLTPEKGLKRTGDKDHAFSLAATFSDPNLSSWSTGMIILIHSVAPHFLQYNVQILNPLNGVLLRLGALDQDTYPMLYVFCHSRFFTFSKPMLCIPLLCWYISGSTTTFPVFDFWHPSHSLIQIPPFTGSPVGIHSSLLPAAVAPICSSVAALNITCLFLDYLYTFLPLPPQTLNNVQAGSRFVPFYLFLQCLTWVGYLIFVVLNSQWEAVKLEIDGPILSFSYYGRRYNHEDLLKFNRGTDA